MFSVLITLSIFILPSSLLITTHPSSPKTPSLYPQPLTTRQSDTQPDSEKRRKEGIPQRENKTIKSSQTARQKSQSAKQEVI
jgi:hypothetical protein